jgi:aspartyl-tRNA(Asn)/glutamyl-tRNA(Gln) amidotransferase subunit B
MEIEEIIPNERIIGFLDIIDSGKVSASRAYQVLFPEMIKSQKTDLLELAKSLNILQSEDQGFIDDLIVELINENPNEVKKFRSGNKAVVGFFMGQAMRKSKGKADPAVLKTKLLKKMAELN